MSDELSEHLPPWEVEARLFEELEAVLNRFVVEYKVTHSQLIGVLQILSNETIQNYENLNNGETGEN